VQRLESERDAVQIMTIHRAKGLEAAVVFLFGGTGQAPYRPVQAFHRGDERWVHVGRVRDPELAAAIEAEDRGENERLLYVALTRACARLYVPAWPSGAQRRAPGSVADLLHARLLPLLAGGADSRIAVEEVAGGDADRPAARAVHALADWRPPADLLGLEHPEPAAAEALARALRLQRGPVTTSYTRLVQSDQGSADEAVPFDLGEPFAATPDPDRHDAVEVSLEGEIEDPGEADAGEAGNLAEPERGDPRAPAGRRVGIFLHEALEWLPMASAAGTDDLAAWAARADVNQVFRRAAERQDLDRRAIEWGAEVVWRGLRLPIDFGDGLEIPGVARAARHQREVDFLFPLVDRAGTERGLVRGAIDLVFEHAGRVYWLDWKSDLCGDYGAEALAAHVASHYTLQAQIYSLALARMLGIESEADHEARFGGLIYLFLRGPAAHVERPGFADLAGRALALAETLR
jgi:exodeoxyribonuclease V beta subunit